MLPSYTYFRVTSIFMSLGFPFLGPVSFFPPRLNISNISNPDPPGGPPLFTPSYP